MANPLAAAASRHTGVKRSAYGGSYAGAHASLMTAADWIFAAMRSADQDIRGDHRKLVDRARELARNDSHARRYLELFVENVVGPRGIRLQAQVRDASDELDRTINNRIEEAWKEWCEPRYASVDGRHSFQDLEQLAALSWARDGEGLCRMVARPDNPFGFALEPLDPDQLDVDYNREPGSGRNEIRMGVEIDAWGRPIAYWLWTGHPADARRDQRRKRVPAEDILQLYRPERPGQTRGVTRFAPVLVLLRMLRAYEEAELTAARVAAAKQVLFKHVAGEGGVLANPKDPKASSFKWEATPGVADVIPAGLEPWQFDPQHPTTAFDAFEKALLRGAAAGLRVSYSSLTGDLSDVNYSSIRAGLLVERDGWKSDQRIMTTHFHSPVYRRWLRSAVTVGRLELPSRRIERWSAHRWLPRGWAWVDPLKDMQAAALALGMRLDSRTKLAAERGDDLEEILEDLRRELDLMAEYELAPSETFEPVVSSSRRDRESDDRESDDRDAAALRPGAFADALRRIEALGASLAPNGNGHHGPSES